ncbi:MAG: hypothetical protein ACI902_001230, partial [Psychroserpens sp.]
SSSSSSSSSSLRVFIVFNSTSFMFLVFIVAKLSVINALIISKPRCRDI